MVNNYNLVISVDTSNVKAIVISPTSKNCRLLFSDGSEKIVPCKVSKADFVAPTISEVENYMRTFKEKLYFTAEAFYNYYASKNWKLGNTNVNDWKSLLKVWIEKDKQKLQSKPNAYLDTDKKFTQEELASVFDDINDIDNWRI